MKITIRLPPPSALTPAHRPGGEAGGQMQGLPPEITHVPPSTMVISWEINLVNCFYSGS
jgi:hypothetical protein